MLHQNRSTLIKDYKERKKEAVMVFCIPKGPKGFHSLMINAEEYEKGNLKIIQATFIGSTDMTS